MQSDTLQDAAIKIGLAKAPFKDLVILNAPFSIHPFNLDQEAQHFKDLLDHIPPPQSIKTLLYAGILHFEQQKPLYSHTSFRDKHHLDNMLKSFFKTWKLC